MRCHCIVITSPWLPIYFIVSLKQCIDVRLGRVQVDRFLIAVTLNRTGVIDQRQKYNAFASVMQIFYFQNLPSSHSFGILHQVFWLQGEQQSVLPAVQNLPFQCTLHFHPSGVFHCHHHPCWLLCCWDQAIGGLWALQRTWHHLERDACSDRRLVIMVREVHQAVFTYHWRKLYY